MAKLETYPLIGITVGDPAGIGPEIVVKALTQKYREISIRPIIYADRSVLEQTLCMLDLDLDLHSVSHPSEGRFVEGCLNFIDCQVVKKPVDFDQGLSFLDDLQGKSRKRTRQIDEKPIRSRNFSVGFLVVFLIFWA